MLPSVAAAGLALALLAGLQARAQDAHGAKARQLFEQAYADQKRGATVLAVAEYRDFLRTYAGSPAVPSVRANLAAALVSLGKFDQAIAQYRKALAEVPGNPALQLNLGLAYFNKGDFRSAAAALSPLQPQEPDNVRLATVLGNCELHLGQYPKAISLLTPLEKKQPDDLNIEWALGQALIQSGHPRQGLVRIQKVADEGHSAEAYQIAADLYLGLTYFNRAKRDAEAAIQLNPKMPKAYIVLGMVKDYSGDSAGAEQEFKKALEIEPLNLQARMELASVLYNQWKLEAARTQVKIALSEDPKLDTAPYLLGRIDRSEGKLAEAAKEFEAAEQLDPSWISPHVELTTLYYQLKLPAEGRREKKIVDQLRAKAREMRAKTRIIEPRVATGVE